MADVSTIRALDAVKALAFIGDLSMGQPTDHSLRTSWLAARLAAAAGHDDALCGVVKEVSLLRWSGCTANASGFSEMLGDDIGGREAMLAMRPGWGGAVEAQGQLEATITPLAQIHCEVSGEIARMLGLEGATQSALRHIFEAWDGGGLPQKLDGARVPDAVFLVALAGDLEILSRVYGLDAAQKLIAQKAGHKYPDALARVAFAQAADWLAELDEQSAAGRDEPLDALPMQQGTAPEIIADVIDLKLPWMAGYSRRVAEAAASCCARLGFDEDVHHATYLAGLIHGMGRMAVSNAIWNTSGRLSPAAWEKVRLVPYWTARAGKQIGALARESEIASQAYERLDGSGYFRGATGAMLGREARVLAAAASWVALRSPRPWRAALSADEAAAVLKEEAAAGRFDADSVHALLSDEKDGHESVAERVKPARAALLSPREAEVLRHISQGASNKEVAKTLQMSPSTVRTHVESVFRKLECSTRAAATLKASTLRLI
ncbi:HD domain-containing phosphohydrolase [Paraburkholderia bryophila]|uniref:HD-GYP domain-containing protein (C-di-GMP phosphodiesterase class II) n=1 Tax=Paraburkholderia bryophila TaxID=420952 RepID=A0A7Y9W7U6_9BURK|nr:HD domain-containing phosphohydrolase [Paraburkholderia bryophila]NYH15128.1 HD-GYP domain-containing protein (c-di-GMP phosphodiesterase class II) [Paraburkholderia bryophila]